MKRFYLILLIVAVILCILFTVSYFYIERFSNGPIVNTFPKIIHMTCKNKNKLSDFYESNLNSWKKFHPDWEVKLYDDDDLNNFFNQYYKKYVKKINAFNRIIFKVDIFKLLVLHKYGGIYVDMDVECLKNFDKLLNNTKKSIIFGYGPYEHNNGNYKNIKLVECAIMIAKANHPFFIELVDNIDYPTNDKNQGNPVHKTGPQFLTKMIEKSKHKKEILLTEPVLFYPINNQMRPRVPLEKVIETKKILQTRNFPKESYCVHYFDGSWWKKDNENNK